jgi:4-aminobutyrate aminotransferase
VGNYLITELRKLVPKYRFLGEVRGKGLMIGMEIVKDK